MSNSDWTCDANGRSNSSDRFLELVREVEQLILGDAHKLINGRAVDTAGLIMAQLAHKHGVGPLTEDKQAPVGEVWLLEQWSCGVGPDDDYEWTLRPREAYVSMAAAMDAAEGRNRAIFQAEEERARNDLEGRVQVWKIEGDEHYALVEAGLRTGRFLKPQPTYKTPRKEDLRRWWRVYGEQLVVFR